MEELYTPQETKGTCRLTHTACETLTQTHTHTPLYKRVQAQVYAQIRVCVHVLIIYVHALKPTYTFSWIIEKLTTEVALVTFKPSRHHPSNQMNHNTHLIQGGMKMAYQKAY